MVRRIIEILRVLQIMPYLAALILTILAEEKPTNTVSVSSVSLGSPTEYQSNTIRKVMSYLGKYGLDDQRALKRVYLSNRSITCNDGSQAGFYLRKSHGSRRWIIYLEGGWYCYDHKSCRTRWMRMRHLMTSTQWPETRDGGSSIAYNYTSRGTKTIFRSCIQAPKLALRNS